ncbi:MAG: hypothetical protein QM619_13060 [Micropruina sp.]|uniref:hypothetical protein n=1 Tax=Micropruina sp. TaxID=2737536 RepID=UPI0039E309AB
MVPLPNPFDLLGSVAARIVVDAWTAAMLAMWNSGLWTLQTVLGWADALLTPDLSETGPAAELYRVTFWLAACLVLLLGLVQLGMAAGKRDGRELARGFTGLVQFALVWAAWIGYAVLIVAAASGLARSLMPSLLGVSSWRQWRGWEPIDPQDVTDAAIATVLGVLGVLIWVAAIMHVVMMLARSAALVVIVATTPISAAGLVTGSSRVWFWKSLRWFHAAAFAPVVMVMVTGIGMKLASGVAAGQASGVLASIATAIPAIVLICVAAIAPLALFRLLAFMEPGTASGAAARAGLASVGGVQGLLRGRASTESGAASTADAAGLSAGEVGGETAAAGRLAGVLGPAGAVAATAVGLLAKVATTATSVMADTTSQMGVGHHGYYPDQGTGRGSRRPPLAMIARGQTESPPTAATSEPGSGPDGPPPGPEPVPASSSGDLVDADATGSGSET